ncbi:MAG: NAD(P)-dependent oxidoreductase [Candidatus Binatia bacterium]
MIRILNAEPDNYNPEAKQILTSMGELVQKHLSQAELEQWISGFDVLIVRLGLEVNREVMDSGDRLRAIVTPTTGLDHIDVAYAQRRAISVLSLKGETDFLRSIPATAEHAWALLLALVRRIPQAFASVCQGEWNRDAFKGHDLSGKRLGVVGLGRIGEKVACYGIAFGMSVAAFSPHRHEWPRDLQHCATLEDLLRGSDVLSLHLPLESETRHMIGARELATLPPRAVLINTSRGEILDEGALLKALRQGHLAGAALDVLEGERDGARRFHHPLLAYAAQHSNLLITPHIGGATVESMARTEIFMAQKLQRWYQQRALKS